MNLVCLHCKEIKPEEVFRRGHGVATGVCMACYLARRKQAAADKAAALAKLSRHSIAERLRTVGLLDVVQRHATAHYVTLEDLCSDRRTASAVAARTGVWKELRQTTNMSLPELGALFGRDHTTVIHALRKEG